MNTVSTLLEENGNTPAEFLLSDYTTFKVVVKNADVIENGTDSGTNGTMRNDERNDWNDSERYEDIVMAVLDKMRTDKRVSVKQLSKIFGKSKTSMFRIIDKLKSDGKIRRLGSEKSGFWEVID